MVQYTTMMVMQTEDLHMILALLPGIIVPLALLCLEKNSQYVVLVLVLRESGVDRHPLVKVSYVVFTETRSIQNMHTLQ